MLAILDWGTCRQGGFDDELTVEVCGKETLLIDGVVGVRKSGVGSVVIEDGRACFREGGGIGRSFVEVRRRIYEGHTVAFGG